MQTAIQNNKLQFSNTNNPRNSDNGSENTFSIDNHIKQALQNQNNVIQKRYDECRKKIENWKELIQINFENLSDSEGEDSYVEFQRQLQEEKEEQENNGQDKKQKSKKKINLEQQYLDQEQIEQSVSLIESQFKKFSNKLNIPKESYELLEAKKILIQKKRQQLFQKYGNFVGPNTQHQKQQKQQSYNRDMSLSHILSHGKKLNQTQNQKKIEKEFMRICQIMQGHNIENQIEYELMKKHKIDNQQYIPKTSQVIGYKHSDFRKLKCYKPDPFGLPFLGNNFEEAEKVQIPSVHPIIQDDRIMKAFQELKTTQNLYKEKGSEKYQKPQNKLYKVQEEISTNPIEPTSSPLKIKHLTTEMYKEYADIPFKPEEPSYEKQLALQKIQKMSPEELERYKTHLFKKQWKNVIKDVFRIHRFSQRSRMDAEQNCKKFAILCAKEVKKKYSKSQKLQKEHQFRAKRLHKEMIVYWKRREKELAEIKKRQERLEAELRKREEEEQEAIKKKKSLEYLMKQAGMFSFIMAKKVGVDMNQPNSAQQELQQQQQQQQQQQSIMMKGNQKEIMYKGKKVTIDIDEDKAAQEMASMIEQNQQKMVDFDQQRAKETGQQFQSQVEKVNIEELKKAEDLDFTQVDEQSYEKIIEQPPTLLGKLKNYQLKGLRWLDNLFTQGINGILADEMGLGKTIQAISLLAHICSDKNIWGPFLIIAPASTLYNWQQEIKKFFPRLKVLPYWGSSKQRQTIRKFFSAKNLGHENSVFHAVITSYQLIVSDEKSFHRIPWQYMVLDEAQNIKNINSIRWQILLTIKARNKLLLTGTPIQNSMAELWALLHFIMPALFNSHEQFQEWFSKDIEEAASKDKSVLNKHQLQRLHMILKPFMLRRIKKDVEHEIGKKIEIEVLCELTRRQQRFYDTIKEKLSLQEFFTMLENKQKMENLMNLVMQFRKVCNHPELFERRPNRSTYVFQNPYFAANLALKFGEIKPVIINIKSPIQYDMSKLVYDEIYSQRNVKQDWIIKNASVISSKHIYEQYGNQGKVSSLYSFLRFMNLSFQFLEFVWGVDSLYLHVVLMHYFKQVSKSQFYNDFETNNQKDKFMFMVNPQVFNLQQINNNDNQDNEINYYSNVKFNQLSLFTNTHNQYSLLGYNPKKYNKYIPVASAPVIQFHTSSAEFHKHHNYYLHQQNNFKIFYGYSFNKSHSEFNMHQKQPKGQISVLPQSDNIVMKQGFLDNEYQESKQNIEIVNFASLVADSAKLNYLDKLLAKLKREGHKVLIFSQMTKMLNILEDFMNQRQYLFFRLDGSTNISDRKDMVTEFQQNPKVFCFLLSTRAGGLGITLTAADVVIFYDNDWNPTMDQQATDRAHRIGQTKDVYVYKMITKGTIEERIVKRAKQKQQIQSTVYGGGSFKEDIMKPQEVMELLFDESEFTNQQSKFQATKDQIKENKEKKLKKSQRKKENKENKEKNAEGKPEKKKGKTRQKGGGRKKKKKPVEGEEESKSQKSQSQQQQSEIGKSSKTLGEIEEEPEQQEEDIEEMGIDLHKLDEDQNDDDPDDVNDD